MFSIAATPFYMLPTVDKVSTSPRLCQLSLSFVNSLPDRLEEVLPSRVTFTCIPPILNSSAVASSLNLSLR